MEKKDAITINLENAPSRILVERMCVRDVEGPIHEVDAQHVMPGTCRCSTCRYGCRCRGGNLEVSGDSSSPFI